MVVMFVETEVSTDTVSCNEMMIVNGLNRRGYYGMRRVLSRKNPDNRWAIVIVKINQSNIGFIRFIASTSGHRASSSISRRNSFDIRVCTSIASAERAIRSAVSPLASNQNREHIKATRMRIRKVESAGSVFTPIFVGAAPRVCPVVRASSVVRSNTGGRPYVSNSSIKYCQNSGSNLISYSVGY